MVPFSVPDVAEVVQAPVRPLVPCVGGLCVSLVSGTGGGAGSCRLQKSWVFFSQVLS